MAGKVGRGALWSVADWHGMAGMVGQGMAGQREVKRGKAWQARRGGARCVVDRLGGAWHGYFLREEIFDGF